MRFLSVFVLVVCGLYSHGQKYSPNEYDHPNMNISGSYYYGTIIKHSTKFIPDVTEKSHAFELAVSKVTKGEKAWQRKLNYPEIGGAFFMARFGDNEVFGNAFALIPYAKFWMLRKRSIDWYFRMGLGLGYLNRPYNAIENPSNNVIGSKINNCTQLSMGIDFKVNRELTLFTALNFTHFSNASFQAPNLGINYAAFSGGFRYLVHTKNKQAYNTDEVPKPIKKNFFKASAGLAFYEYNIPGGIKFPVYRTSFAYARSTSIVNRIMGGLIVAYDVGRYEFVTLYYPENKRLLATEISAFVGDEIFLGKLSLDALLGVYLNRPFDTRAPIFAMLGLNYHLYQFGAQQEKSVFVGAHLKTHYFVAQYFDITLGVNL